MKLKYPLEKNRVMSRFFLIASVLLIISCQKSNEDKARELIKQYFKENSNDPESYEPLEFGKLEDVTDYPVYKHRMLHKYRASNGFDAKTVYGRYFYITEDMQFAEPLDDVN